MGRTRSPDGLDLASIDHMHISKMIESNPAAVPMPVEALSICIEACFDCSQACTACADACLGEESVAMLTRCIRLNQDCADVCIATGRALSRQHEPEVELLHRLIETCALACQLCAVECERHAGHHDHCRVCAEACRACMKACEALLAKPGTPKVRA